MYLERAHPEFLNTLVVLVSFREAVDPEPMFQLMRLTITKYSQENLEIGV